MLSEIGVPKNSQFSDVSFKVTTTETGENVVFEATYSNLAKETGKVKVETELKDTRGFYTSRLVECKLSVNGNLKKILSYTKTL